MGRLCLFQLENVLRFNFGEILEQQSKLGAETFAVKRYTSMQQVIFLAGLADGHWFPETTYTDEDLIPDEALYYYIRVTTEREEFVWPSLIWVDR